MWGQSFNARILPDFPAEVCKGRSPSQRHPILLCWRYVGIWHTASEARGLNSRQLSESCGITTTGGPEGWRHVKVTDRHTAVDYAHVLKELADIHFAKAKTIVLVQDNLNIHRKASLYEAFPAAEARRLVERFEWHYTPKHGSWLDLAESELGVLSSQCLDRRIPDKQTLIDEITAWEQDRNVRHTKANWHFTTANARIKLKHLYPSI
jgi:hypothetical protein